MRLVERLQKCFKSAVESIGWSGKVKILLENKSSQNERGGEELEKSLNKNPIYKKKGWLLGMAKKRKRKSTSRKKPTRRRKKKSIWDWVWG